MVHAWGMTDIGLVRRENQDCYGVEQIGPYTVCVVCDGMGGHSGGRVASHMAVAGFLQGCRERLTASLSVSAAEETITDIILQVNRQLYRYAQEHEELRQMGTTLVSAVVVGDQAIIHNVGDSRCHFLAGDGAPAMIRLTKDHSLVENLVAMGNITPEEARKHPDRNVITRALGPEETIASDAYRCTLARGDRLLLCTDGLTGALTDEQIAQTLWTSKEPCAALEHLRKQVYECGAGDNLTAVFVTMQ